MYNSTILRWVSYYVIEQVEKLGHISICCPQKLHLTEPLSYNVASVLCACKASLHTDRRPITGNPLHLHPSHRASRLISRHVSSHRVISRRDTALLFARFWALIVGLRLDDVYPIGRLNTAVFCCWAVIFRCNCALSVTVWEGFVASVAVCE